MDRRRRDDFFPKATDGSLDSFFLCFSSLSSALGQACTGVLTLETDRSQWEKQTDSASREGKRQLEDGGSCVSDRVHFDGDWRR